LLEEACVISIDIFGDFDISRTADLRDSILTAEDGGGGHVVVDLSGVTFMDSSALRALLEVRATLADRGSLLTLVEPPPGIATLFSVTGMAELFGL
jgi:anti-anti-sigma factor